MPRTGFKGSNAKTISKKCKDCHYCVKDKHGDVLCVVESVFSVVGVNRVTSETAAVCEQFEERPKDDDG